MTDIKPLEWEEKLGFWQAQTNIIACYSIWDTGDHWECSLIDGQFKTAAKAKEAAQRDWDDRIRAAIAPEAEILSLRSSLKEIREENGRLKGDAEAMAKALEPFSKFAGIVFERNFNNPDPVDTMTAADGRQVTLLACDFFRVRAALADYRKERG
jgi:hypothetical protein